MRIPWMRGCIESAAWISDDTLLVLGWSLAPADALTASISTAGGSRPVELRCIGVSRPDLPDRTHPIGKVMTLRLADCEPNRLPEGTLIIDGPGGRFSRRTRDFARITGDPAMIAGAGLGWLDASARESVIGFLIGAMDTHPVVTSRLANSLRDIRNALRDRRRPLAVGERTKVQVDHVLQIDERLFYVKGWSEDTDPGPLRLTAISPEGRRAELLNVAFRYPRPDLGAQAGALAGFVACVRLNGASVAPVGWLVEVVLPDGGKCEADGPVVETDLVEVRRAILEDVQIDEPASPQFVRDHAFPALARLQERHEGSAGIKEVVDFGSPPRAPDVSIVVPLFRRTDLLEHQLSHFVDDPEMASVELVYVLDSPELARSLKETAAGLYSLYRTPFRLVVLPRHLGLSLAINAGVAVSRGRLVLLLNSDVFPARPGWLRRMVRTYDGTPRIGALGPKLLFEDDTLQHAGLYFDRSAASPVWINRHYYKGYDRRLPAANVARAVPAVTGAALMLTRQLFLDQGGLRACYINGDYEDTDLCLRLSTAGYENWYTPEVELYHLEGQSYQLDSRRMRSAAYNAWLHDHLWSDTIESVMRRYPPTHYSSEPNRPAK